MSRAAQPGIPATARVSFLRRPGGAAAIDWLIVGLGNPGAGHSDTRHNVGFMVLDELAARWRLGRPAVRFRGKIVEGRAEPGQPGVSSAVARGPRVALLWPQTFMNESGLSVGPARGAYHVALDRVLVVHDEIDVPFGDVRTRLGGGLAGHNGLKSLKTALGGPNFWRVRVGVGRPDSTDPEIVAGYVLARFSEGRERVQELVGQAASAVEGLLAEEHVRGDGAEE